MQKLSSDKLGFLKARNLGLKAKCDLKPVCKSALSFLRLLLSNFFEPQGVSSGLTWAQLGLDLGSKPLDCSTSSFNLKRKNESAWTQASIFFFFFNSIYQRNTIDVFFQSIDSVSFRKFMKMTNSTFFNVENFFLVSCLPSSFRKRRSHFSMKKFVGCSAYAAAQTKTSKKVEENNV